MLTMISSEIRPISSADTRRIFAPYSIGYRVKLLSQLIGRRFQERLDPFGLTPFHWIVLCCLWQEDGLATSSIGDKLQQVGGTLTGVLDRMVERDLIYRQQDSHDRRIWRIWLTESGRDLQTILPPIATGILETALRGLPDRERQQLAYLIDRILHNLQSGESLLAPTLEPPSIPEWRAVLAPYNLGYRIKLIAQLGARRFQEKLDPFGLTPFHWLVLCCLWQEDGLATSSIGDKLQQVGGTLTGVLDRMTERELIHRRRDGHDRRVWRIWLTDAGRDLKRVLPPVVLQLSQAMMFGISEADQETFSQWVNQGITNLQAESAIADDAIVSECYVE